MPDGRRCFDVAFGQSWNWQRHRCGGKYEKIHSVGTAAEFYLSMVRKGGQIAWDATVGVARYRVRLFAGR